MVSRCTLISGSVLKSTPHKTHSRESRHKIDGILDILLQKVLCTLDWDFATLSEAKGFNPNIVIILVLKFKHVWLPLMMFLIRSLANSSCQNYPKDAGMFLGYPNCQMSRTIPKKVWNGPSNLILTFAKLLLAWCSLLTPYTSFKM